MGRPIKSKYFGTRKGLGVGGEGVATVTLSTSSLAVSTLTITVSFAAPGIAGGTTALGTPVKTGNTVTSVLITEPGSGYLAAPTVTFTGTNMTTQGAATAVLSTTVLNVIKCDAYVPTADGGSSVVQGDIQEQVASKKYRVITSQGTGTCRLVTTSSVVAGQLTIIATDTNGSTYYVKKLTARRAVLVQSTASGSFVFDTNAAAGWTVNGASAGVVSIANR
jgi:hypothetical protein